ncbi:hypothetical protein H8N03_15050 [Ramlibacter sp. USB13]|uniref:Uncharacterized protein n=1 Tax=Ramlibacter cellulosilyticus TaxID=2764187 RepID=A0A923MS83_9BURK|nr:hypothetical protein [Ramlibacter cellulosilyticus]MBC5784268.1 hypothetical protein [Ramlibacter cellulosilyticus]
MKRAALLLLAGAAAAAAHAGPEYRNVTTGKPLRPGIYGRITVAAKAPPPPVIYAQPVIASQALVPARAQPVYLYVPPGQVRKWKENCARWSACDQAVLFVRVDDSPSRWGKWRERREAQLAMHERD